VLKEILPDANRLLGYEIADAPQIEGQTRQRLIQTILGLFKRHYQPMLLILEDLHWADELDLLAQLNTLVPQLPLMIVASYRSEESPALAEALPQMQVITLSRLDDAAIVALSQAILGEAAEQSALLDLLRRETEGNAFFMVEVMRALAEEAGGLDLVGHVTLPDSVFAGGIQEIVRRRLGRVPDWARALLKLAAIGGRQLDRRVMELLAVRVDYERWLNVCANAAVLEVVNDRWRFAHDKLRDGVLDGISLEEAPTLYREVAIAVELIYTDVPDHAAMIAKYWSAAGDGQKELHYTAKAAKRAMDLSLYHDAQRLLHRILHLEAPPVLHMESLILLGEALEALGDYTDACDYAQQALEIARKIGSVDGMAQALKVIGNVRWREGAYDVAEQYLLESLQYRKLPITLIILGDVAWSRGDLGTARIYFERARRLTMNTPQYYVHGEALQSLATVLWRLDDIEGAKQLLHESIAIKQQIGNQRGVAASINSLGIIAERQGDLSASAQYFELSLGLYEQLAIPWGMSNVACNLAFVYLTSQELDKAAITLNKGLQISTRLNSLPVTLELIAGYAQLVYQRDEVIQAAEWAGLVQAHPATNEFTHTIRLKPLKAALETETESDWQAAFERGKALSLADTLTTLLAKT
jgi:predicted ATPase